MTSKVRILFIAALIFIQSIAVFGDMKVLSDLDFSKSEELLGWQMSGEGNFTTEQGNLIITTDQGTDREWSSNTIAYKPGFSLQNSEVKLEVDISNLTNYRDLLFVVCPQDSGLYRDPSLWINIGGHIQVRQFQEGIHNTLLMEKMPFEVQGRPSKATLILKKGFVTFEIKCGSQSKVFELGKLFGDKYIIKPFTIHVGVAQHGNSEEPAVLKLSAVKLFTSNQKELNAQQVQGNVSGKSEDVKYISLDKYANRRFQDDTPGDGGDGWTDQGSNDMRYIPRGYQFFRNVPFFINDRLDEVGNAPSPAVIAVMCKAVPGLPAQSKPILIQDKAEYLYFLHAGSWANTAGENSADYVVTYEDGSVVNIPLITGKQVNDWWDPEKPSDAYIAWIGKCDVKDPIGFYLYEWKNPNPGKKVESVILKSNDKSAMIVLIALTVSDRKIEIGPEPRRYQEQGEGLCEYRHRPKISLYWKAGPNEVKVKRSLAIDSTSQVKQARFDIIRYHGDVDANISCSIAGVTKNKKLKKDELKAVFIFNEADVLEYINENRNGFEVYAATDDPQGLGSYTYGNNPNHHWVPEGEDFNHGIYNVIGVFEVTGWLPIHSTSKYIEVRPNPEIAAPAKIGLAEFKEANSEINFLGSKLCLNGPWQWQPGFDRETIPLEKLEEIVIPVDVGDEIFARDQNCISAWFKKEIFCPADWAGKRLFLEFMSVADFATVYINGKKSGEHAGIQPFEIEIGKHIKLGQNNTIHILCDNVYRGIIPTRLVLDFDAFEYTGGVSKFKGNAYRLWMHRGAWDQKPDEIELLMDGKNIAQKAADIDQVVNLGDGRYYMELFWDHSILYFSLPDNVDFESIKDRLGIAYNVAGVTKHLSKSEPVHHWNKPQPRRTGVYSDIFLRIEGESRISDIFIKPSVRKMSLGVDIEVENIPDDGVSVETKVFDGSQKVLDFGTKKIARKDGKITLNKFWEKPQFWGPSNPYLYHLRVDIKDKKDNLLDRRFVRFGFKELWIDGTDFMFNGKPIMLNGESETAGVALPTHRAQLRYYYADRNQNANINIWRWHQGGMNHPETCDIADEMGMLLEPESNYVVPAYAWQRERLLFDKVLPLMEITQEQIKWQRNHPSIALWSADNEAFLMRPGSEFSAKLQDIAESILTLNTKIKEVDPTRPIDNQGDNGFLYTGLYKDPRLEIMNTHYVSTMHLKDWRKKIGKPIMMGETSMGGDFGWTYQWIKDPEEFWKKCNPATNYIAQMIKELKTVGYRGIWPFSTCKLYNPTEPLWKGVEYWQHTPKVPWPAYSGENVKLEDYLYGRTAEPQFWDPNIPRGIHVRTYNPCKDELPEAVKLEPRFSPEIIVQVLDVDNKPVKDKIVWLVPTTMPGSPIGVLTDNDGKAWFWCKPGHDIYKACIQKGKKWYTVNVEPEVMGDWLQVKTVKAKLPMKMYED